MIDQPLKITVTAMVGSNNNGGMGPKKVPSSFLLLPLLILLLLLLLDRHVWEGGVVDVNDSAGRGTAPITRMEVDKTRYILFLQHLPLLTLVILLLHQIRKRIRRQRCW